ncbi:hypothetical protein VTK26DRAFT_6694 [Humicola hyalothermophila]
MDAAASCMKVYCKINKINLLRRYVRTGDHTRPQCTSSFKLRTFIRKTESVIHSRRLEGEGAATGKDKVAQRGKRLELVLEGVGKPRDDGRQQAADEGLHVRLYGAPRVAAADGDGRGREGRLARLERELHAAARLRVACVDRLDGVVGAPAPVEPWRRPDRRRRDRGARGDKGLRHRHGHGAANHDGAVSDPVLPPAEGCACAAVCGGVADELAEEIHEVVGA